jgi:hypothetical protein
LKHEKERNNIVKNVKKCQGVTRSDNKERKKTTRRTTKKHQGTQRNNKEQQ